MNAHMDTSELRMLLPQDKKNRDIKGEGYDIPLVLLALFARPSSGAAVASEKLQRSVSVFWRCTSKEMAPPGLCIYIFLQ